MYNVFVMWRALALHRLSQYRLELVLVWNKQTGTSNSVGRTMNVWYPEYLMPVCEETESILPKVFGTGTRNHALVFRT